ncbi:hypothetical protein I3760_12G040600 [Carya illinoinensis]|nr:hypothetical protein I3760_12G040600 [Carya illinoinensis]
MGATISTLAGNYPPEKCSPASNTSRRHDDLMANSNRTMQTSIGTEDVEEIASWIQGKLSEMPPPPSHECSIFRVPNGLRRHNEKAFVPQVVSIGPFHHENKELKGMEKIKLWYLKCLLNRAPAEETVVSLVCLVKAVGSTEQDCRESYAEEVDVPRKKFVEMMILDGCFILEFLCRYQKDLMAIRGEEALVPNTSWMPRKILADLLLLENQIPWCVLDCLFNLMPYLKTESCSRLDDLVSSSLSKYGMFPPSARSSQNHKHLLDCFRNCLVIGRKCLVHLKWSRGPSVTEFLQSGYRFVAAEGENILNFEAEDNKIIKMAAIFIEENTESMFRNLIAYEHCDPSKGYNITYYAARMYSLIKSPADALHLKERNIIQIGLSNEDIASFLNQAL